MTNNIILTKEQIQQRLSICHVCPHYRTKMGVGQCRVCGCAVKIKSISGLFKCPKGKWKSPTG